jgi:glycosyltransferase involved in cell wall biosynthesis
MTTTPPQTAPGARRRMLFVSTRYLFPAESGGKIRPSNILRGLKGGAFEVVLASPVPRTRIHTAHEEMASLCDRFVSWRERTRGRWFALARMRHLLSALPISVATDISSHGAGVVAAEIENGVDLVVVDFPHAAVLAPPPYACPSVLFTHNVEGEIYDRHARVATNPLMRRVMRDQAAKMARFERSLLPRFTGVIAVAERDRDFFATHYGAPGASVIPTGVDLDYFTWTPTPAVAEADGGTIVFTGAMDWLANIDGVEFFMDEAWPLITQARPRARCVIVGRSPPPALVERARARGIAWTFTGYVDDVRPYVRDANVFVIPLRVGGGTRIKVYEAMALGCPVVSTPLGVEGLPVVAGRDVMVESRAEAMARSVLALLADDPLRDRVSRDARRFVEEGMSSRVAAGVFEGICLRALAAAGERGRESMESATGDASRWRRDQPMHAS